MSDYISNVDEIFCAAIELSSPVERGEYVDRACGGNAELRHRVDALLAAHFGAGDFLERSPATALLPERENIQEGPGTLIGHYKLLEQIGEGGMGVVYMADQQAPVRRRVALKIIKAGMDTRQVIARFEAERQALALMDHTSIARVLDAGATDSGRPYFVMELVRGIPITEYCDQNNLPLHERLELFVQVCHAVQHAHQKGIIHRDLKPSNVLVTLNDGRAVPKVIDFGVAKATGQQLTEKTLFTAFAQMVGTPLYMSPEQAEMTSVDIDTRSDIYSLGVLLYELLTGTTPFDQQRMRAAAFDEIRRIIREEEPPKPSMRISTLGESRTATAAHRQVDSHRLGQLVEGDLDWIVMKALEKDRTRRYDTAGNFAADVLRHLSDEPVEACPPTRMYRLTKFIRRNKAGVLAAAAIIAALAAGLALATIGFVQARRQAELARIQGSRSEQVAQFLRELLEGVSTTDVKGRDTSLMRDILDKAAERVSNQLKDQPEVEADLLDTIAGVYFEIGPMDKAEKLSQQSLEIRTQLSSEDDLEVAKSLCTLGKIHWRQSDNASAESLLRKSMYLRQKLAGPNSMEALESQTLLGGVLRFENKLTESAELLNDAVNRCRNFHSDDKKYLGGTIGRLGGTLFAQGKFAEAEKMMREAVAIDRTRDRQDRTSESLKGLGEVLFHSGRLEEAENLLREAVSLKREQRDAARDIYLAWTLEKLSEILQAQDKLAEAEGTLRESLAIKIIVVGNKDAETERTANDLVQLLNKEGKSDEADKLRAEFKPPFPVANAEPQNELLQTQRQFVDLLRPVGRNREASELSQVAGGFRKKLHERKELAPLMVQNDADFWAAINRGRALRDGTKAGDRAAASQFEESLKWARSMLDASPSQKLQYAAATAELELGICRFEEMPTSQAVTLIQHAAGELRRLSLEELANPQYLGAARWAQGTLVVRLMNFDRLDEAKDAARQMADWLAQIAPRASDDPKMQKDLQEAQSETRKLLRWTGEKRDAKTGIAPAKLPDNPAE